MTIWYKFARTGMVAFGLMLLLGLVHALKPAAPPVSKVAVNDEPLLAPPPQPAAQ
jgi:hypothetical protein